MKTRILLLIMVCIVFQVEAQSPDLSNAPVVRTKILDSRYDFKDQLLLFSQRSLEDFLGLPQSFTGTLGIYRPDDAWPPAWLLKIPEADSGYAVVTDFKRNWNGSYFFWQSRQEFTGYIWLDSQFEIVDTLNEIEADPHGILLTRDGKILWAHVVVMDYRYYKDSLPVIGHDIYEYDPATGLNRLIFKRNDYFTVEFHNPAYKNSGNLNKSVRDGDHFNWLAESVDGHILINDRHTGYGKIDRQTGNVIWWGGLKEGLPNTITPVNNTSYKDVQSHLGHHFHQIADGPYAGYYTWFDNGDTERKYSRVVIVDIDDDEQIVELIREYRFPWSRCMGSVDFLPDSTFIANLGCNASYKFIYNVMAMRDSPVINEILENIYHADPNPSIFWMQLSGDTIATYTLPHLHGAYTVQVIRQKNLPTSGILVDCTPLKGKSLLLGLKVDSEQIYWSTGEATSTIRLTKGIPIYAAIPVGIGYGYSRERDFSRTKKCN